MKKNVVVIGAGPAGIIASATASNNGHNVILLEKNEIVGKKMLITGNGRCNITNLCPVEDLIDSVTRNKYFLYSAFYSFTNDDIVNLLKKYGLEVKIEEENRCFPVSDKSMDVTSALEKYLKDNNVSISFNSKVNSIKKIDDMFIINYSRNNENQSIEADKVIIATGGKSYPATGSTGDGYNFAKKFGHKIISLAPSMVPFNIKEDWIKKLKGISLNNVMISLINNKEIDREFGDIIFTHYGISGPCILNLSCRNNREILENKKIKIKIDLFPDLNLKEVDEKLLKLLQKHSNKNIINIIDKIIPYSFGLAVLNNLSIEFNKKGNQVSKEDRQNIARTLKGIELNVNGLRPIAEAYITSGGVDINEVNSSTMESNIIEGLYFCGEVLDVDAYTGGFNLQIAYSTGYIAGKSC